MQNTRPQTIEDRVSTLEVEMLYTNKRIIEAITGIKTTLEGQETRFARLEKQIDSVEGSLGAMQRQLAQLQSTSDTLTVKLDDVRAVVANMQDARLNEMDEM